VLKRILTALIGIPLTVFLIRKGGFYFSTAVLILAIVSWFEFAKMSKNLNVNVYALSSGVFTFLLVGSSCLLQNILVIPILTLGTLIILCEGLYRHCNCHEDNWQAHVSMSIFGLLYVGLLFSHFPLIRNFSTDTLTYLNITFTKGELALWMIILGTWASDTFAYFFGCAFGKHKLCSVSPKKSIEGAIAGFVFAILITSHIAHNGMLYSLMDSILLGVCVSITAPVGDLIESILKRSFDIKDSGNFFPGHGGVLDRLDSLLYAVPVSYYLIMIFEHL